MLFGTTAQCSKELDLDCTLCDTTRRRAQWGVGDNVAQQVNGHARSKYQLRKLLSCLKNPAPRVTHDMSLKVTTEASTMEATTTQASIMEATTTGASTIEFA